MEEITSRKNPLVRELQALADSRSARRESGRYLCQGRKLLEEALQNGVIPDTVLTSGDFPELPHETRCIRTTPAVLAGISTMQSVPDLLFTAPIMPQEGRLGDRILIAENLQDPGNVGTLMRTAGAFGFREVLLCGACADPYGPKAVRASMGAVFRLPVREFDDVATLLHCLRKEAVTLYAAALADNSLEAGQTQYPERLALAVGNEGHGLSRELLDGADAVIRIPMEPGAESLNAAAAAAVLMWEVYRERSKNG